MQPNSPLDQQPQPTPPEVTQSPQQPLPPQQPQQDYAPATQSVEDIRRSNKKKLVWGIICLVGPTLLLVVTILGYALANLLSGAASSNDTNLFAEPSTAKTISNIVLFLIGAVSILTWLPGIIVGIILLAKRQKV